MPTHRFMNFQNLINGFTVARKTLRHNALNSSYIRHVLYENGIDANVESVKPLITGEGYASLYYQITATKDGSEVAYFASMSDIFMEPFVHLMSPRLGYRYQPPRRRKQKDFDDMQYLSAHGVPTVQPVAFDRRKIVSIESFEEGISLRTYLDNPNYSEDSKMDMLGQAFTILKQVQDLGRHSPDVRTENFYVRTTGGVIINDMEIESALSDPSLHELAVLVYSASHSMDPRKVLQLVRELYDATRIRGIPRYSQYLILNSRTRDRTDESIKEF